MKLSDSDRARIMGELVSALIPMKIETTPPAKDGTTKAASRPFAAACWAMRYLDAIEYVLEKGEQAKPHEQPAATARARW